MIRSISKRYLCHSLFAWLITILCGAIPIFTKNYGEITVKFQDNKIDESECSIKNDRYYLAQFLSAFHAFLYEPLHGFP